MDHVSVLESNLQNLPAKDHSFAQDLLRKARSGYLSEKQRLWIERLARRSLGQDEREHIKVGEFATIIRLFEKAAEHLTRPGVLLACEGKAIRLTVASAGSKYPGSINVATKARYGEGVWFGRILKTGEFQISPRVAVPESLIPLLKAFAANPEDVATAYSRVTHACCFCGRYLKDHSAEIGFGKRCGEIWGISMP